jgi:hypothetical protein
MAHPNGKVLGLITRMVLASSLQLGCGIETTIPSGTPADGPVPERAVKISQIHYDLDQVQITCELNKILVAPGIAIPLFIEFEGARIESITIENVDSHQFTFTPGSSGRIVCVVELSDAEFESESEQIDFD